MCFLYRPVSLTNSVVANSVVAVAELAAKKQLEQKVAQDAAARSRLEAVLELVGRMKGTAAASAGLDPSAAMQTLAELYETLHHDFRDEVNTRICQA